jgi:CcmD family protein
VAWLGIAFVIVWVLVGAYVVRLARAQRDIARRLDAMERSAPKGEEG